MSTAFSIASGLAAIPDRQTPPSALIGFDESRFQEISDHNSSGTGKAP
jgi:hypothetical protein